MDNKVLLNLVDTALSSDTRAMQMCLRKLAQQVRENNKDLYDGLIQRLESSTLRTASPKPLPVDSDSRLNLVKVEDPVLLENEPIHSSEVKSSFDQVILERNSAKKLLAQGLSPTKSILFQGPPGVGKTMSARWLAKSLQLPLITLDLATVMSSYLGKTGSNIRTVLEHASSFPCVLLLDEFDAIAKRRDDDRELGELKRLVTVLLQAIDNWPDSSVLIAATNHSELLDPAIWRRFDISIEFTLPDSLMRYVFINSRWPEVNESISSLVSQFENKSYSDIERYLIRMKKESILSGKSLTQCIDGESKDELSIDDKKAIAIKLHSAGESQRSISKKLGMSRQTIKSAIANKN